jgi:nitroreductase
MPGPNDAQVRELLQIAVCVPDHGRLTPWRFLRINDAAREALGSKLVEIYQREHPDATEAALEKERTRFSYAPLVMVVIARITAGHKIPEIEQRLSAGAVCLQLVQAATAMGFGAQWLTGWAAYHPGIRTLLGLASNEEIIGFVHIGTANGESPAYQRPDAAALLTDWNG